MIKHLSKLLLIMSFPAFLFAETMSEASMEKLSPDLQALVIEKNLEYGFLTDNRNTQVQTVTGTQREVLYPVTFRSTDLEQVKAQGIKTNSDHPNWSTARVTFEQLIQLTQIRVVTAIFQGDMLYPLNDLAVSLSGADLVHDAYLNNIAYDGTDVIVLIIDTGIDWSHLDFRGTSDDTQSRILYIWDQTETTGSATPQDRDGSNFSGLDYGVEYTNTQIENEIDGSPAGVVSTQDTNGHGTAVASAAAGNGASLASKKYSGMAPGADIVVVRAGVNSFTDGNVKDALTYAEKISATESKPVVVNLSLGNQSNAHDGTSTLAEAVDAFVASGNGRVAVVAAGNEGNESIHVTATVAASATGTVTITVPSFSNTSGASNDYFSLEMWWSNSADVTAVVKSPDNTFSYTRTADQTGTSSTTDGTIQLFNDTDSDHSSGDRRTFFQVHDGSDGVGPEIGDWSLEVTNNSASTMTYHAWLYASSMGATVMGGDTTYTISSPATASAAISVGAYTPRWRWYSTAGGANFLGTDLSEDIAYFSSIGPTRGGDQKPDITAPGRGLYLATSKDYTPSPSKEIIADKYHLTEGSSGAAGVVTGGVALILDYDGTLSAATIKSRLTGNADSDTYTGSIPNAEWGYGKLNIFESLAKTISSSATVDHDVYAYDDWGANSATTRASGVKDAVKFTPTTAGDVTGAFFHTYTSVPSSGSFSIEIWSDNGSGLPSSKLGSTVSLSAADVGKYSWNYVSLVDANVSVLASTHYHLVIDNTTGSDYTILLENNSIDQRSSRDLGAGWGGPYTTLDWRIRPVVATNEEALDSSLPVELAFFHAANIKGKLLLKWATESEFENLGFSLDRRDDKANDWKTIAHYSTHPELEGQGSTTIRTDYMVWDKTAKPGIKYDYRLSDIPYSAVSKAIQIILEDVYLMIDTFELFSNYPNPFNPSTHIAYQLAKPGAVSIMITDIQGREIRSYHYVTMDAGYQETLWDGLDHSGKSVGAGVYFTMIQTGSETRTQKMLLLR